MIPRNMIIHRLDKSNNFSDEFNKAIDEIIKLMHVPSHILTTQKIITKKFKKEQS